jgi:hypothetical protein
MPLLTVGLSLLLALQETAISARRSATPHYPPSLSEISDTNLIKFFILLWATSTSQWQITYTAQINNNVQPQ